MLAIRMQRTGRKGHAMFRMVVQDSRRTPTSGKVVAQLGSYDPHAKSLTLDKEKASFYLEHGAQPSDRIVQIFKSEGVKLPKWLVPASNKERTVRHPEKRRSTAPAAPVEETPVVEAEAAVEETEAEQPVEEATKTDAPVEEVAEAQEEVVAEEAEPESATEDATEEE